MCTSLILMINKVYKITWNRCLSRYFMVFLGIVSIVFNQFGRDLVVIPQGCFINNFFIFL